MALSSKAHARASQPRRGASTVRRKGSATSHVKAPRPPCAALGMAAGIEIHRETRTVRMTGSLRSCYPMRSPRTVACVLAQGGPSRSLDPDAAIANGFGPIEAPIPTGEP